MMFLFLTVGLVGFLYYTTLKDLFDRKDRWYKMTQFKLYSDIESRDTILQIWGGSTKHPDCVFHFSDFKLSEWFEPENQIAPWLFECASRLNIPYHSYELAKWAVELFEKEKGLSWN